MPATEMAAINDFFTSLNSSVIISCLVYTCLMLRSLATLCLVIVNYLIFCVFIGRINNAKIIKAIVMPHLYYADVMIIMSDVSVF